MGKGKGKRKHKNKPVKSTNRGNDDGTKNGVVNKSGVSISNRNTEKSENDILLSLEESVDWHNQTSGFVSSYTLPAATPTADTSTATSSAATDDIDEIIVLEQQQQVEEQEEEKGQQQHATTTTSATMTLTNSLAHQPITMTRNESLESTASSKVMDTDNDSDGEGNHGGGISDIFRPPSRSPSRSPQARTKNNNTTVNNNSNVGSSSSFYSPTESSIASDSTDAVSNLAMHTKIRLPGGGQTNIVGVKKSHPLPIPNNNAVSTSATAVAMDTVASPKPPLDMVGNVINASNIERETGISPLRSSPPKYADDDGNGTDNCIEKERVINKNGGGKAKPKMKKRQTTGSSNRNSINNNSTKRSTKKNNLVIQPSHISRRCQSFNPQLPNRLSPKSSSSLPPPHPMSNVQSYPPSRGSGSRSPTKRNKKQLSNSVGQQQLDLDSNQSWMSDAESSAGGSEATPIMSPARPQTFSFSSADTEEENEIADRDGSNSDGGGSIDDHEEDVDLFGAMLENKETSNNMGQPFSSLKGGVPDVISAPLEEGSSTDLKGIDISFQQEDEGFESASDDDDDDGDLPINMVKKSASHPLLLSPSSSPNSEFITFSVDKPSSPFEVATEFNDFKGDTFFATAAAHTRQFSSDDRFFEGIHNSGLSSLSFEQVADMDLNTSTEAEIELVYNGGDAASFGDNSSVSAASFASFDEEGRPQNEEERKVMEKRILQWRRGRQHMLTSTTLEGEEEVEEDGDDQEFTDDEFDEALELAPLTSSSADDRNIGEHSSGYSETHRHPRKGWFWWRSPIAVVRNYIWRLNLRPDQHIDIVLDDDVTPPKSGPPMTPKKSNLHPSPPPSPSPYTTLTFNTDGAEDDDDGDETKGLTSKTTTIHSRRKSKHYDDVDFDRDDRNCCYRYFCCCCKCCAPNENYGYPNDSSQQHLATTTWHVHSGWKKLLAISSFFLLLAWVVTDGKLVKHHDSPFPSYIYGDPLARDNFMENMAGGRMVDDEDDYYTSNPLQSVFDDDNGVQFSTTALRTPAQKYNKLVGIDSIVVLGSRHTGKEWLINRLKKLYPDMNVVGDFSKINSVSPSPKRMRALRQIHDGGHRFARVIDPTSGKFLPDPYADPVNPAGQRKKTDLGHILVVAVFLNPYDWIELLRVDPIPNLSHAPKLGASQGEVDWKEFIELKFPVISNRTVLEFRGKKIRDAMIESLEHKGVKIVIPIQYEELVEPYSNYDNYIGPSDASAALPGIIGLMDRIQAQTGLHPDESAGWKEPSRRSNPFWADPIGCSGHICFMSINKMREDAAFVKYMNKNVDWEAERLIGYHKRSIPKPAVDQIVILGERHTGAQWLVDRVSRCFPTTQVKYGLFDRPGKWFQSQPDKEIPKTLIISVFLNPYDWVELMRQHPINAPAHKGMEWSEFVTSPWERKRSNLDNQILDTANAQCSFGFSFEEIVPCKTNRDPSFDSFPLYELRLTNSSGPTGGAVGDPYSSLLELRADKIRNFLSFAEFEGVVEFISMRYEDLVMDDDYANYASDLTLPFPGIAGLFEKIRDRTSLVPDVDAGWISDVNGTFKAEALGVGATKLDPYYVQWMQEHVDWNVETLVGYSP